MNEERRKRSGGWYWWIAALALSYVLSGGPMLKSWYGLERAGYDLSPIEAPIEVVYAPLEWAYGNVDLAEDFFDWYLYDVWQVE